MNNKRYLVTGILSMVIGWATNVFALDDTLLVGHIEVEPETVVVIKS